MTPHTVFWNQSQHLINWWRNYSLLLKISFSSFMGSITSNLTLLLELATPSSLLSTTLTDFVIHFLFLPSIGDTVGSVTLHFPSHFSFKCWCTHTFDAFDNSLSLSPSVPSTTLLHPKIHWTLLPFWSSPFSFASFSTSLQHSSSPFSPSHPFSSTPWPSPAPLALLQHLQAPWPSNPPTFASP